MITKLNLEPIDKIECDALIVVAFEGTAPSVLDGIDELYQSKEFTGKPLEVALLHRPPGLKARRLLLVGGGKPGKFTPAILRRAAGADM